MNLFYPLLILFLFNLYTYGLMIMDKRRAIKNNWRVSEQKLFTVAAMLGFVGILLAMLPPVNHKKSKASFKRVIWAIVVVEMGLLIWLFQKVQLDYYFDVPF